METIARDRTVLEVGGEVTENRLEACPVIERFLQRPNDVTRLRIISETVGHDHAPPVAAALERCQLHFSFAFGKPAQAMS